MNYYDGQGFMVKKDLGVTSAKELDGATVCIQTGTTTELNLADFFKANNITYTPVTVADDAEAQRQYLAGACDAYTTDASGLAASRATLPDAGKPHHPARDHLEGAARPARAPWRQQLGRHRALDLLRAGRRRGAMASPRPTSKEIGASTTNPEIKRLLGIEGDLGAMMGLDDEWAKRAIAAGGNYGEIFAAQHRRAHPDRPRPRPERAVDPGRPAVRPAVPLI